MNNDTTASNASSGTTSDLSDQLKSPLSGSEVGEVQGTVCIDHTNQEDIGEIQTFGNHLRSQQNIDITTSEHGKNFLVASGTSHGIAVHSRDTSFRKLGFDFGFQSLRPQSTITDAIETACRAGRWCGDCEVTIVADCFATITVVRERHIAVWARDNVSACWALNRRRKASPIEEQDGLPLVFQCFPQGDMKWSTDCS